MHNWMGNRPLYMPLTLLNALVVYGVAVVIIEASDSTAAAWVSSALFWALTLLDVVVIIMFATRRVLYAKKVSVSSIIVGFIDGYLSLIHAMAGVFTSVVILGNNISDHFALIPAGTRGYNLYFTYALSNTVTFFNTVGQANVAPVTAVAALWTIAVSIMGVGYLMLFLSLTFWTLRSTGKKEAIIKEIVHQFPRNTKRMTQKQYPPPKATGRFVQGRTAQHRIKKR